MAAAREAILWSALAVALSASWFDLARHAAAEPWARPAALFVPLFALAAARSPRGVAAPASGGVAVAAGLGLSLLAVGGGFARLGRLGIPLAVVGMARGLGRPPLATALLALWMIPPPARLLVALAPGLEQALAAAAAALASAQGVPAVAAPYGLELAGATLPLQAADGGIPLVIYLAGIGWWRAARAGGGLREALGAAARFAPFGLLAQAAGLAGAFALLAGGAGSTARALLDLLPWPVLGIALLVAARPRPARSGAR